MPKILKERGIMFRGELVHPILDDIKLVTRRMSKTWLNVKKGRKLYVRENFAIVVDGNIPVLGPAFEYIYTPEDLCEPQRLDEGYDLVYQANEPDRFPGAWRPAIHMFRWMSRIDLEATEDARLERLLDITEEDAKAEGVRLPVSQDGRKLLLVSAPYGMKEWTFREAFLCLWSQMHRKKGERVEDNPEMVRIAFKRIHGR
jgi:hypothetical protein